MHLNRFETAPVLAKNLKICYQIEMFLVTNSDWELNLGA